MDDLLPVVAPDSQAARDHRDYKRTKAQQRLWVYGLFVGLAAGVTVTSIGFNDEPTNLMWTGVGITAASFLIGGTGAYITGLRALGAQRNMFEHYDAGLAAQLNMCANGMAIVPCDAPDLPGAPDPMLRNLPQR